MNQKERAYLSLTGKPVDRFPVSALYNYLYFEDHFSELTGLPSGEMHRWLYSEPDEYFRLYRQLIELTPFELLQIHQAPSRAEREASEFISRNGRFYRHDRRSDEWEQLDSISGHPKDYTASEVIKIFDRSDIARIVEVKTPDELVAAGYNDYITKVARELGNDHYIISSGIVGTIYSCGWYVGQQNALAMLVQQPRFMEELCSRVTEQNLAVIGQLAQAGGDAIYIDDATATNDMISPRHYEHFCLPYMTELVKEIHRLGHHAILIYFGGVMDRLEMIASTGADGLLIETSMKGFINDIEEAVQRVGKQITFFGNIDPVRYLQDGTDDELSKEIQRQCTAGKKGRGFILSPASPITPKTPLHRVQKFLKLGRNGNQ